MNELERDIAGVLLSKEDIEKRIQEMARNIYEDYKGKDLVIISILKGSVVFLVHLMKHIPLPFAVDFIEISSYEGSRSTGIVRMIADLRESIEGKDVLVIEDIVDTGLSLAYLKENLLTRRPKSLKICVLLDKMEKRTVKVKLDYVGFNIPDKFVVGYGLDFHEKYRNLPYIGMLKSENI